jgi:fructose-1-phosphate kinase PfkB-like protein
MAQFLGMGAEGNKVYQMMESRVGTDAMSLTVRPKTGLRTCTSLVAPDTTTELVEPSGTIADDEMAELLSKLDKLEGGAASAICIMGSMPPGCADSTYAEIYERISGPDTLCEIDSVAGLEPLFKAMADKEERGQIIFKVNASELCKLAGVKKSNNEVDGISREELLAAISGFLARYSPDAVQALTAIAITDGRHPAHLAIFEDEKVFHMYQVPVSSLPTDRILFPIGAGDAVAAGTLAAWQCLVQTTKGGSACLPSELQAALQSHIEGIEAAKDPTAASLLTALSFGLACGSASCLEEENSVLQSSEVLNLFGKGKPALLSSYPI